MTTERPAFGLTLAEMDPGSWLIVELPGFTTAASGAPQKSLDALRKASGNAYYKSKDALWVKLVSDGDTGPITGATLQVSRQAVEVVAKMSGTCRLPRSRSVFQISETSEN